MHVHGQLRPKPSKLMLRRLLRKHGVARARCILVEDTLANLKSAKQLGLRTVWVTQYLRMAEAEHAGAAARRLKKPRLRRCQSKIRAAAARAPAPAALNPFNLTTLRDPMASTKPGQRKLQILQALAGHARAAERAKRSPPRRWRRG
jgi:hypothetical protein